MHDLLKLLIFKRNLQFYNSNEKIFFKRKSILSYFKQFNKISRKIHHQSINSSSNQLFSVPIKISTVSRNKFKYNRFTIRKTQTPFIEITKSLYKIEPLPKFP